MRTRTLVTALTVLVLTPAFAGRAAAQAGHVLVPADQVKWGPAPSALPAGAEISVLEGNPAASGSITLRLKFPAHYAIPAHWHSMPERVTVLSGTLQVGMGRVLDRAKSNPLHAGGFVSLPARNPHFVWTTTPTVVQISLEGPFDIFYVNPADDPQAKTAP
jgi:hypothetical protein